MHDNQNITAIFLSIRSNLARAVTGIVPPKDIEDIVQETYVRVCQAEKLATIRKPHSFLYKTARNLALDHIKRAESRLATSVEDDPGAGFGEAQNDWDETLNNVASREEFSTFCDAVRRLPVQCRRAFVLKKVYGYTQREIARELGLSESTIEKHIATGIKRCTYFMMQHGEKTKPDARNTRYASRAGDRA